MRILIVTQFFLDGSGSGIYVQNEAMRLLALGHDVRVVAPNRTVDNGRPFTLRTVLFGQSERGPMQCEFDVPYFTTHPVSKARFVNLSDDEFSHYIKVWDAVLEEEIAGYHPDVIHMHHASIGAGLLADREVPYVITLHGTDLMGYEQERRFDALVPKGVRGAAAIISISRQVTEEFQRLLPFNDNVVLIHNGFDEKLFYPRPVTVDEVFAKHGLSDKPSAVVSFAGKLAHFKGVDLLIRAATIYEKRVPGVITLIVGHGQLREELEDLVAELGVKGIRFLGLQPQNNVAEVYSIADVSTVPSREEPFGLVAIEALACGTPVVATAGGGLPDFINDTVGRLVALEDWEALGDAIADEILGETKQTKGSYGARYALEGFSWSIPVQKMVETFAAAAGETRKVANV